MRAADHWIVRSAAPVRNILIAAAAHPGVIAQQLQVKTRIEQTYPARGLVIRSTCNQSRTHDNFSTLPLLC